MATSLAQGIRQAARDQEAARLARDTDASSSMEPEDQGPRRLLGNAPIRYKLWAILVVPIAATLLFAALQIGQSTQEARSAEQVQALAGLGVKISALGHELQQERGKAASLLGEKNVAANTLTFESQYRSTDAAVASYRDEMNALSGEAAQPVIDGLNRVDAQIKNLKALRDTILKRQIPQAAAAFQYTTLVTDLLGINEAIADAAENRDIADRVRATAAFSRLKEFVSQEEAILLEVLAQERFEGGKYRDFVNSLANQEAALVQFAASATPEQRRLMDSTLTRSLVEESTQLESRAIRAETAQKLEIDPRAWYSAMTKKIDLLREVEVELGNEIVDVSGQLKEDALRQSLIQIGLVLLTFIIAMTISLVVARSMVRPLTRLRSSALEVANHSLPEVVRRLRDTEEQPPDFAGMRAGQSNDLSIIDPMEFRSNDEIGQVARAFNAVHLEAVRVATEQAQLRRSVSTMFVNLSRRSQLLVDRLIRLIDNLEQGEQDPDRLADLFKLDHLATRMRRNDENLLVLAGADAGRRWNQPASLVDVLRAATAEVEQYTRVRLGNVDDSIEVAARAVNDMVHLVAELLENATSFSSPRTDVVIDARRHGDVAIIEIEDQGIGMSKQQMDELNDRLARPPVFDVSVSRMMGLFVVGRLATRHTVQVSLRSAKGGGTLAVVTLSAEVLTSAAPRVRPPASPIEQPTQPVMTKHVEAERADAQFARTDLASKDEPRTIPTIDSTVVQSSHIPTVHARGPVLPTRPADSPATPIRAISSRPNALPPAASATESATGQYVQLGPIAEPVSPAPGAASASRSEAPAAASQLPAKQASLGVSSAAAAMAVLRSAQPTTGVAAPPLFADRTPPSGASAPSQDKRPASAADAKPASAAAPVAASSTAAPKVPTASRPAETTIVQEPTFLSSQSAGASADLTVEMPLPIFDAIESEWFRSSGQRQFLEPGPVPSMPDIAPPDFASPLSPPVATAAAAATASAAATTAPQAPEAAPAAPRQPAAATAPVPPAQRPAAAQAPVAAPAAQGPSAPASATTGLGSDPMPGSISVSGRPVPVEPATPAASAPSRPSPRPVSPQPAAAQAAPPQAPSVAQPTVQQPATGRTSSGLPSRGVTAVPPAPSVPTARPAATAPAAAAGDASGSWNSPADAGWKAAQAAAETKPDSSPGSGLPKRVPMAHFVPGRVDQPSQRKAPRPTTQRSPDAVRGVLSSYRHGLEQGRQASRAKHAVATERENEQEEM